MLKINPQFQPFLRSFQHRYQSNLSSLQSFDDLSIKNRHLLRKITGKLKYITPTDIQREAIPLALSGRSLLISSMAGTGKTLAYVLPILNNLMNDLSVAKTIISKEPPIETSKLLVIKPKVVVILPTNELSQQVYSYITGLASDKLKIANLARAKSLSSGDKYLNENVDILVSTPGILRDAVSEFKNMLKMSPVEISNNLSIPNHVFDLRSIQTIVIDEADLIFDKHEKDMDEIMSVLPVSKASPCQTLLCTATITTDLLDITNKIGKSPLGIVNLNAQMAIPSNIKQEIYQVPTRDHKLAALIHLLPSNVPEARTMIFVADPNIAKNITSELVKRNVKAGCMHAKLTHISRQKLKNDFKLGKEMDVMVCTGVMGRGMDIPQTTHVINYDFPSEPVEYLHRVGRCGRGGRNGVAISLLAQQNFVITLHSRNKVKVNEIKWWSKTKEFIRMYGKVEFPNFENLDIDYDRYKLVKPLSRRPRDQDVESFPDYDDTKNEIGKKAELIKKMRNG